MSSINFKFQVVHWIILSNSILGMVESAGVGITNLYPTTITELKDLRQICLEKKIHGVDQDDWKKCLVRTFANNRTMADISQNDNRIVECRDVRNYRGCFSKVTKTLNECVPGRGDTVQKIQFAIYHEICMDGGSVLKGLETEGEKSCTPNYEVNKCTSPEQLESWKSLDGCRSIEAFRSCQEEALRPCMKDSLTKLVLQCFLRAEINLNCSKEVTSSSAVTYTSRFQQWSSNNYIPQYMLFIAWICMSL